MKKGVRIVNVGRGPIIDEKVFYLHFIWKPFAALDVFEKNHKLNSPKTWELYIWFTYASNTIDGVIKTNNKALKIMSEFLGVNKMWKNLLFLNILPIRPFKKQFKIIDPTKHLLKKLIQKTKEINPHSLQSLWAQRNWFCFNYSQSFRSLRSEYNSSNFFK